jgi:hypothetical protein
MTEKLKNQDSLEIHPAVLPSGPPVRRRGRPKGAKNKPKISNTADAVNPAVAPVVQLVRRRGRPKGAKNKPKVAQTAIPVEPQLPVQEVQLEEHPLLKAVKWLEKYMHPCELQYYRNRANKAGVSLPVAMASDILGFFNVQNPEICKQIKKNNFITNTYQYDIHQ